jgi:8-oxo-dGTP pyrophosphatase MutT (NUDIX family)
VPLPVPASTVVLIRPAAAGIEVFLVRRHDQVAFMGGAHVFPGGRVDEADTRLVRESPPGGFDVASARMSDVAPDLAIATHVAATRELFEEAGVLLARDTGGAILTIDATARPRFQEYRAALTHRSTTLAEVIERERLRLALDELAYFAHWVTPQVEARRFDTRFFMAVAPGAQDASHDDHETTQGSWIVPDEAIERCRSGEIALPPPTWTTLRALARFDRVDQAMSWARSKPVPRVEPGFVVQGDTRLVILPGDPTYPPLEGFEARETRFLLANGRWTPVDDGS